MTAANLDGDELLRAGFDVLSRELGLVGMIRFIQQLSPGKGDYTAERQQPSSLTFEEFRAMTKASSENSDGSTR